MYYFSIDDLYLDPLLKVGIKHYQSRPSRIITFVCEGCKYLEKRSYEAGFHDKCDCKCLRFDKEWTYSRESFTRTPDWCKYVIEYKEHYQTMNEIIRGEML